MTERAKHLFHFRAHEIARAAAAEAAYHESRVEHWAQRRDAALEIVKSTASAKVTEHEVTGGVRAGIEVDYGDREAWDEYQLAYSKVDSHRASARRFRTDEGVYRTQGERPYELDTEDVHHFRLGQPAREA